MKMTGYKNWRLEKDSDHILWCLCDKENASTNSLNAAALTELSNIATELSKDPQIKALVIGSAKKQGFIAGADIEQFQHFKDFDEALTFIKHGQHVFDQLAALTIPTVAMIEGFCLGGGLELALACRYRVAEEGSKTKLGLPEVKLGIHPGWGGTARLPRLIGGAQAMELIMSGRTVDAKTALKMGIIDAAVPKRMLKRAAHYYCVKKPKAHKPSVFAALTNQSFVRPTLGKYMRTKLREKIRPEHYPAPFAALDHWIKNGVEGDMPFSEEAKSISELMQTDTAKNLIRVFFLQGLLKDQAKGVTFAPRHVHVVGAGVMGGDIAAWCALQGLTVTLQDREAKLISPAIKRAYALYKKKLKSYREVQAVMDRLIPDPSGQGVAKADIIIEAIFENLEAKRTLFKALEMTAKPGAILATNTSSIPLDEINTVLKHPERLVGIHFFNPVSKMQLVEVVHGQKTDKESLQKSMAFVRKIDRLPLSVTSNPGFLVNRVLMPYLMEAMQLLEEGISPEVVDEAALHFGMPMGPIELADAVGLDVCLAVADNLTRYNGGTVSETLRRKVTQGDLGVKSGRGFYAYKKGHIQKKKSENTSEPSDDIAKRLIACMLNESAACLREGVVATSDLLDAGMIFGVGFAPFRGGPMHYAKTIAFQTTNGVQLTSSK